MIKKLTALIVSGLILVYVPTNAYSKNVANYKLESLVDVKIKHWSYPALKYVVEDLGVMSPKTQTRFLGDKLATRYELANAFYSAIKELEVISEKRLKINESNLTSDLTDVNEDNKTVVNSIVNEYRVMQLFPDAKFMGNREMTRYELAYDMNNYLMLLERKLDTLPIEPRDKASELTDLSESHFAYKAVKNIVDNYKIMDGYPQKVFGGEQKLTRYEVAALLRRFVEHVDKKILSVPKPTPTPIATPTPEPTIIPTPIPTPEPTPTPIPKAASSKVDLRVGAGLYSLFNPSTNTTFNRFDPGLSFNANVWFSKFGISLGGDYLIADNKATIADASRLTLGATANYRILGDQSDEDVSLFVGIGYGYTNWFGTGKAVNSSGPKATVDFEAPLNSWIGLNLRDSFTYAIVGESGWRNDLFAGFTSPAYNLISAQLGYVGTTYSATNVSNLNTQHGLELGLRLRF